VRKTISPAYTFDFWWARAVQIDPINLLTNGDSGFMTALILLIIFGMSFLMNFTDIPQRIQLMRWSRNIRVRLYQLERMILSAKNKASEFFRSVGLSNSKGIIDGFLNNFFIIEPVNIEPTDIIRRLDHLIRSRDTMVKKYVEEVMSDKGKVERENATVVLEIVRLLHIEYKVIKHYYLTALKHNNWVLMMQLALSMPQIMRELEAVHKALDAFATGKPVGDSAGALVASKLMGQAIRREITEDTVMSEVMFEGRKLVVIKAEGPGATVGRPGEAVEKLVERLGYRPSRIITVDAALKLEGEESGEIAFGSGAAIGDPGPEKIRIERVATKCGAALDAVVIKMSIEEAINEMTKEIAEGCMKALETIKKIIKERTKPGDTVIVIGVGNSIGVF